MNCSKSDEFLWEDYIPEPDLIVLFHHCFVTLLIVIWE